MRKTHLFAELAAVEGGTGRVRQMTVNTGVPVYRFNFWSGEEYYLQLSLDSGAVDYERLRNGPVTINHDRSVESVVGVVEDVWLDGALKARARFSETPSAEETWQKMEEGILRQVSVEAAIDQLEKQKEKFEGLPLYKATKWSAEAVSIVPVGADRGATLMSSVEFDAAGTREAMRGVVRQMLTEAGLDEMAARLKLIAACSIPQKDGK